MSDLIHLTRVYDAHAPFSFPTFLIDRLWPRGISKARLESVEWFKDIAPSSGNGFTPNLNAGQNLWITTVMS